MNLHRQRCFRHAGREAAARCPSCARFYCRECIVEHDGRLLCTACLEKTAHSVKAAGNRASLAWLAAAAAGLLLAWASFYYTGSLLAQVPSAFHEESREAR